MRYTLYGQGEGLSGHGDDAYITVANDVVWDASVSAAKAGIQIGWPLRTAMAMVADIRVLSQPEQLTEAMQNVYQMLWNSSPLLMTEPPHSFSLQIQSRVRPLMEVKSLLLDIDMQLSNEQRFRVGLAENPFLARALVYWSRIERVPKARYYRVRRQQFMISPALAAISDDKDDESCETGWVYQMPVQALWFLTVQQREQLHRLGIYRLGDLERVPNSLLTAHFGKEALLWLHVLQQSPGGKISVNYPPIERRMSWRAAIAEESSLDAIESMLDDFATSLCQGLQRSAAGALGLGLQWRTNRGNGTYEHQASQPVYQPQTMIAQLVKGRHQIVGERIESLDLYVYDLRPLQSMQSEFLFYKDSFYPIQERAKTRVEDVRTQLVSKFPKLRIGMKPNFRERRMDELQRGWYS